MKNILAVSFYAMLAFFASFGVFHLLGSVAQWLFILVIAVGSYGLGMLLVQADR